MTQTNDRLATFVYLLIRDHVPFGVIAEIIHDLDVASTYNITNSEAFRLATSLADRILYDE